MLARPNSSKRWTRWAGALWASEHGPQGGDEINRVQGGRSHGWPLVTYGRNYGIGTRIGEEGPKAGFEAPLRHWVPTSVAPSGLAFLTSDRYPGWKGSLFMGTLRGQALVRLTLVGNRVTGEEKLPEDLGARIRDVRQEPTLPAPLRDVPQEAIELIKAFEGIPDGDPSTVGLDAYLCPANVWTIGWGHAVMDGGGQLKGAANKARARQLYPGGITREQAEALLRGDLVPRAASVSSLLKVAVDDPQFGALMALVFNIGAGNLAASTLLRKLNAGDTAGAAEPPKPLTWRCSTEARRLAAPSPGERHRTASGSGGVQACSG